MCVERGKRCYLRSAVKVYARRVRRSRPRKAEQAVIGFQRMSPNGAKFDVAGAQLQPSPYGIAVDKKNTELRDVLVKALNQMIREGSYENILQKWGVAAGAVQNAVVNGGF